MKLLNKLSAKGFTLIELLIVIAILGVLAAGILVAIDPVEQINKGRDAGRKSSITQLGRALQAYYTSQGVLPAQASWSTDLVGSGEIKIFPVNPPLTSLPCSNNNVSGYCYWLNGTTDFIVYSRLDSKAEQKKGGAICAGGLNRTYFVYASTIGRAGIFCDATSEPIATSVPTVF